VAGTIAVEAEIIAIPPPIASSSSLFSTSIPTAALIAALGLVLLATTRATPAIIIPR